VRECIVRRTYEASGVYTMEHSIMSKLDKLLYTAKVHATSDRSGQSRGSECLLEATHKLCPYSRATHGNIDVTTTLA